jgi:hypothetical protein
MYVCPVCDVPWGEQAIDTGELTAEHVPPESFGGRELVLTCKRCNNEAGFTIDADARRKENVVDAVIGGLTKTLRVRVSHRGLRVNARLKVRGDTTVLDVGLNNHPDALRAFREAGPPTQTEVTVDFFNDKYSELGAKISWLRSAYLLIFALEGYRFSYDPALQVVKQQILNPRERAIFSFTIEQQKSISWSTQRILQISEPRCIGVQFGRYVILPPQPGDVAFHDRLQVYIEARPKGQPSFISGQSYECPREPTFGPSVPVR